MHVLAMPSSPSPMPDSGHADPARRAKRKRIPEVHDGERERLSKRLSLLRLEQQSSSKPRREGSLAHPAAASHPQPRPTHSTAAAQAQENESMQLDDSKHRIYIHNIDDELSSDSECDEAGKLVFLPDIRKHLMQSSIPRRILANDDGELAGMQLVLYREPKALSVPEEQDNVRKAVSEARQRIRDRQRIERLGVTLPKPAAAPSSAVADDQGGEKNDEDANDDYDYDAMELD